MQEKAYNTNNIKIEKLYKKEGIFETPEGHKIRFMNVFIEFTIGDYPLVFTAKVDKAVKEYVDKAGAENAEN